MKMPWNDRSGRFSLLKALVLACLLAPGVVLAARAFAHALGPRPLTEAIHQTGDWAFRFLLASLAVTPLRRIFGWSRLILVRRMTGLAALFYVLAHVSLYCADQNFDAARVLREIFSRYYLMIGFAGLLGLIALGATSTDAAIRRLGRKWTVLHRLAYVIGVVGGLHFFMQTKADVHQATWMVGLFSLLMLYRLVLWRRLPLDSAATLGAAAVAAALVTAGLEFAWYGLATGVPPGRVLAANFQMNWPLRPAWVVLAVGLVVMVGAKANSAFLISRAVEKG